jgi:hypothetical protein
MNPLCRWKVVFLVIATFVAGALTGGFFTISLAKNEVRQHSDPRRWFTVVPPRFTENLKLTPEQDQKVRPILQQIGDELNNLRAFDLRETEGILSRGQDRIDPLLKPDQRAVLHKVFEDRKQRVREWLGVDQPES